MIPRYQRVLFWILFGAILLVALFLLHGCQQAREKLTRRQNETPLVAPVAAPNETVRFAVADDGNDSISMVEREMPLPTEPTARAHALIARLIAEYSYKSSAHPIESGPAIDDVFLLDLPLHPPVRGGGSAAKPPPTPSANGSGGQLAVVNLNGSFADHHPSGIEPETLTIDSIIGTLYANFPRAQEVRFLVDGNPRATLNGHADLTRSYPVVNTETKSAQGVR